MKQITLFIGTLFLMLSAQAQSGLFEQTINAGSGFATGHSDISSIGFYSADDFELTQQSDISSVTVFGFQPDNNLDTYLSGFSLYIYSDVGGAPFGNPSVPGTGLLEIVSLPISDPALTMAHPNPGLYYFTVDIALAEGNPLTLAAGTYWLVAVPHYNIDSFALDPNGDNRLWYWYNSGQQHLSDSQYIDPTDLLGGGWTSWAPVSDYPTSSPSANAFSFAIQGDNFIIGQNMDGWTGFTSGYSDFSSFGFYSADDFQLRKQSEINSITVYGSQPDNDLATYLTGFSLYIYSDAGGVPSDNPSVPGTGLLEIVNLPISDPALTLDHPSTSRYSFTVDIAMAEGSPLSLPAGTYWLVAVPHSNIDATTIDPSGGDPRLWYWYLSKQQNLSEAQFIDPANYTGGGWTSWTPISDYPMVTYDRAFAFTIMGESLAIADFGPNSEISLYPNPVKDELHLNMQNGSFIESASIFDLLGKRHQVEIGENNSLDVSKMPPGLYLLKLKTSEGSLTKKFIKE